MALGSVGVWGRGLWLEESRRAEAQDVAAELDELGYAALWLSAGFGQGLPMVFGELLHGEVQVRIWIHPDHRKRGYGTGALRKSRTEMAWCFPAAPLVVRTPAANPSS